jgi:hypothetical protein
MQRLKQAGIVEAAELEERGCLGPFKPSSD